MGGGDDDGSADGEPNEVFTVGIVAPLTGNASLEGNALSDGFTLAVDEINADEGLLGNDIELVYVDDQGDAAQSTQAAQQLIQQDEVDYIFGTVA